MTCPAGGNLNSGVFTYKKNSLFITEQGYSKTSLDLQIKKLVYRKEKRRGFFLCFSEHVRFLIHLLLLKVNL